MAETVIIEFIASTEGLAPAVDQLERLGQIDKATATTFKATNAELKAREATLKATGTATKAATDSTKKSIADVDAAVKNLTNDFVQGFQEGVVEALKEAGVSAEQFQAAIAGAGTETKRTIRETSGLTEQLQILKERLSNIQRDGAFSDLQNRVNTAKKAVVDTAAELERLSRTGGTDTERFSDLTQELAHQQEALQKLEGEYEAVIQRASGLDQVNQELERSTASVSEETQVFADRIAKLKADLQKKPKTDAYGALEKQLNSARREVLNTSAALEHLKKTGGAGTENFDNLNKLLALQQTRLKDLEATYQNVSAAIQEVDPAPIEQPLESIRSRLKEITQELTQMKVSGEAATNPGKYAALTAEAGNLQNALGDVNAEIARAGSSTGAFDSLIQISQGVAGGFAVAQGAAAIFGDESEELQEVLLRVNAAMAVLQGLQQVQAAWAGRLAIARGLETAATVAQTVAQTAFNVVVGASTGLLRVFRIALAATGIGLLIIAVTELVSWLSKENNELEKANRLLERNKNIIDADTEAIRSLTDEYVALAEARNALESEIISIRGRGVQDQIKAIEAINSGIQEQMIGLAANSDAWFALNKSLEENQGKIKTLRSELNGFAADREKALRTESLESQIAITEAALTRAAEGSRAQLALQQKLVKDKLSLELNTQALTEAQRLQLIEAANREQLELRLSFNKRQLDLEIRGIEDRLKSVEEGSSEELRLRIDLLRKQAAAEVSTTRLSEAEKQQIRQEAINEQVRLELAFAAEQRRIAAERAQQVRADFIQVAIARNQTELALAAQGSEERLHLEIVNIELAASEARRVAGQNAIEINRINAEAQAQILALRRQFAEQAVEYEIRLEQAKNGRLVREQQRILSNERSTFQQRVRAMNELFLIEVESINRRLQALRDQFKEGLISQKEYNLAYAELEDERARISEETEQQILAATRARTRAQIQTSVEVAAQLVGFLDSVYQAQSDKEQQRIEEQRTRIDELRESGAITEKEAERRRRLLEQEERRAQQRQAQREKQIAVFRALLAIPQAFLQGVAQGGPILGAIYAAIAAAQAAIVISQPIPRFGKGKKDNYEGLAEVGETGAELIESNGQMYVAPKKTIVWLGAKDKVYNPRETIAMLEKPGLRAAKLPEGTEMKQTSGMSLDYDKLGRTIAQHSSAVNLNIDGYKQFILNGHAFTTYLNNRRGF